MNKVWRSNENWKYFYFTIIPCILCLKKKKQNKTKQKNQQEKNKQIYLSDYSWNKDGLKLFLFREYKSKWLKFHVRLVGRVDSTTLLRKFLADPPKSRKYSTTSIG